MSGPSRQGIRMSAQYWLDQVAQHDRAFRLKMAVNIVG
ncbi:hypothetical protein Apau_0094 [Aminomonas paucivorans DSM 12260]|uniref:Uncharacterized protein n=1 Tax=Aminomonas paucivorans DSM 12260 TaxID=584708 RepID=E3CWM7_9BACT|nr:hypothetical protein Apau_0094 [Aminomonas paucivorans DSM 12260]